VWISIIIRFAVGQKNLIEYIHTVLQAKSMIQWIMILSFCTCYSPYFIYVLSDWWKVRSDEEWKLETPIRLFFHFLLNCHFWTMPLIIRWIFYNSSIVENTLRFLIWAGIFTKVWIEDMLTFNSQQTRKWSGKNIMQIIKLRYELKVKLTNSSPYLKVCMIWLQSGRLLASKISLD
jgi:hypothetical protein